jgi:hypothetical protein
MKTSSLPRDLRPFKNGQHFENFIGHRAGRTANVEMLRKCAPSASYLFRQEHSFEIYGMFWSNWRKMSLHCNIHFTTRKKKYIIFQLQSSLLSLSSHCINNKLAARFIACLPAWLMLAGCDGDVVVGLSLTYVQVDEGILGKSGNISLSQPRRKIWVFSTQFLLREAAVEVFNEQGGGGLGERARAILTQWISDPNENSAGKFILLAINQ